MQQHVDEVASRMLEELQTEQVASLLAALAAAGAAAGAEAWGAQSWGAEELVRARVDVDVCWS